MPTPKKGGAVAEKTFRIQRLAANVNRSRDPNGRPCLVFLLANATVRGRTFRGISLSFIPKCRVVRGTKSLDTGAAILTSLDPAYADRFEAVAFDFQEQAGKNPTQFEDPDEIIRFVQEYAQLFSRPTRLDERAERGLWGELYLLGNMPRIQQGVEAWQGPARNVVDFARNGIEIEVKTALGTQTHRLRPGQIQPPTSSATRRTFWSLSLRADPASGHDLGELVRKIRKKVTSKLAFEKKLAAAGYDETEEYSQRWTVVDERAIAFADLPKFPPMPTEISNVEFDLDIAALATVPVDQAQNDLIRLTAK